MSTIIYTKTDEAPALATYSLLPIIKAFSIKVMAIAINLAGEVYKTFILSGISLMSSAPSCSILAFPIISVLFLRGQ